MSFYLKIKKFTRSNIKKLINSKKVNVNNNSVESQSKKIKKNDLINISLEKSVNKNYYPSKKKLI